MFIFPPLGVFAVSFTFQTQKMIAHSMHLNKDARRTAPPDAVVEIKQFFNR